MKTKHPEQDYSAGAYVSFSPIPVSPSANKPIGTAALAILFLTGGALALFAAVVATRPYQLEAQQAKAAAVVAKKEAATAKSELSRIRRCVVGGN